MLKLKLKYFGQLLRRADSFEKTLMLGKTEGGRRRGGEGDDRGWDGWMASPIQWTWVWVNSRSWWWTGRPRVLQSMGLQRVWHNWATKLNWPEKTEPYSTGNWIKNIKESKEKMRQKKETNVNWESPLCQVLWQELWQIGHCESLMHLFCKIACLPSVFIILSGTICPLLSSSHIFISYWLQLDLFYSVRIPLRVNSNLDVVCVNIISCTAISLYFKFA